MLVVALPFLTALAQSWGPLKDPTKTAKSLTQMVFPYLHNPWVYWSIIITFTFFTAFTLGLWAGDFISRKFSTQLPLSLPIDGTDTIASEGISENVSEAKVEHLPKPSGRIDLRMEGSTVDRVGIFANFPIGTNFSLDSKDSSFTNISSFIDQSETEAVIQTFDVSDWTKRMLPIYLSDLRKSTNFDEFLAAVKVNEFGVTSDEFMPNLREMWSVKNRL